MSVSSLTAFVPIAVLIPWSAYGQRLGVPAATSRRLAEGISQYSQNVGVRIRAELKKTILDRYYIN